MANNYNTMMDAVDWVMQNLRNSLEEPVDDEVWKRRVVSRRQSEANLLNKLVLGMESSDVWGWYEIVKPIRDHLPGKILAALNFLEGINTPFLYSGLAFQDRRNTMEFMLKQQFPDVVVWRDEQLATIEHRNSLKLWKLMPVHPMNCPQLHYSNQYMIDHGFTQTQLDAAGNVVFAGLPVAP